MARRRGTETIGDMARSLGLVLVVVAVVGAVVILSSPREPTVRDVDYGAALADVRESAPFAVVGPEALPDGWTATRVGFSPGETGGGVWRMSFVTPDGEYVGLVQSTGDRDSVVEDELPDVEADGSSVVAGQTWQRLVEAGGGERDRALVADVGDTVVVLRGSGDYSSLEEFASRLR
jgi:hypothetical protein